VSERAGLILVPEARIYDHGPQHPLRPERVLLTWELVEACGLADLPNVERIHPHAADDPTLQLVHTEAFIDATRRAGHGEDGDLSPFGYGPGDNPIFDQMHEAGALVAGASVAAAEAVWTGTCDHAFNAAGGLHHAMPSRASGFCVYDDPAVAIAWLLREGAARIAYVDVDVHHGDGVQEIFWDDPRVLTVSIHQYAPWFFFPGTGGLSERGGPHAPGSALNVPLPPGVGDSAWLAALEPALVAVSGFEPDVLVTQLGCDTHASDPLAQMRLTTAAYRRVYSELHGLAHEAAGGKWVATGGGGYQWASVVPRAWTLAFAEMAGQADTIDDELPASWVAEASARQGAEVPSTFSEPPASSDPDADEEARRVAASLEEILGD
jgi:acetoin utilization protein AcuC